MGPDQQVVPHSLTPLLDGDFLLSLFLERRPSPTQSRDTVPTPADGVRDPT